MVRNCTEIGLNLQKIMQRLLANQNLIKLLYYNNKNPLAENDIPLDTVNKEIKGKLIKIVPYVDTKETANSIVAIRVEGGDINLINSEFRDITIVVENFVPFTEWTIKDSNLRPFAIMGEIQKSLKDKSVNGLGKISGGDFSLNFLTTEVSCYQQVFKITSYY